MSVTCEHFESLVLELAYGELDDAEADRLRTHAAACAACRASLDGILLTRKMAATPAELAPSDFMDRPILDAAAAFAAAQRESEVVPEAEGAPVTPPVEGNITWLERFRGALLKPAFATAAVAAMVLVVTTFVVQKSPDRAPEQPDQVSRLMSQTPVSTEPQREEKAVASSAAAPPQAAPPPPVEGAEPSKSPFQTGESTATAMPPAGSAPPFRLGTGTAPSPTPTPKMASSRSASPSTAPPKAKRPTRRAKGGADSSANLGTGAGVDRYGDFESEGAQKKEAARQAPVLRESDGMGNRDFDEGVAAFRRGDCQTAKGAFERVAASRLSSRRERAVALHHIGRCEKRRGQCGRAVSWYDRVLAEYPEYAERGDALFEAAQCRRRLGHLTAARSLLVELRRMPGQASRAQQALDQIDRQEAAGTGH